MTARPTSEATEVALISVLELFESSLNPRKSYPADKLQPLTDSMRNHGFRGYCPLIVRPMARGGFEIAAGNRHLELFAELIAKKRRSPLFNATQDDPPATGQALQ